MKKILIRAHMSPFDNWDAASVLQHDMIGTNAGNMIFINSIIRVLMTEDVQIDIFNTRRDLTAENLERINAEYSCVVMPFANAFRPSFQWELQTITRFVKKLKIPCVVAGAGVSATFLKPLKDKNSFDETVKEFVRAILDKSAVLGTRGEETSAYLSRLGFKEGSDHRVIGCPSMFWYGETLPEIEKKELTKSSPVSVNWKIDLPEQIHAFMRNNVARFEDFQYVPQITDEIRLMYYGTPLPEGKYKKITEQYPCTSCHPWYVQDRARAFINVPSWFAYLREKDFSFGSRIHGNIAALLAGIPGYVIVSDYRILELVRYHHIPHTDFRDLKEGDTIFSLYEKADYTRLYDGHKERFENYKHFLEENGLEHTYGMEPSALRPYDRKMNGLQLQPELKPFFAVSVEEQARRLAELQRGREELRQKYEEVKSLEMLLKLRRMDTYVNWFLKKIGRKE